MPANFPAFYIKSIHSGSLAGPIAPSTSSRKSAPARWSHDPHSKRPTRTLFNTKGWDLGCCLSTKNYNYPFTRAPITRRSTQAANQPNSSKDISHLIVHGSCLKKLTLLHVRFLELIHVRLELSQLRFSGSVIYLVIDESSPPPRRSLNKLG